MTRVPGARDVYDPQGGRPGERDVAEQPRGQRSRRTTWRTMRDRRRAAAARPRSLGAGNVTVNLIEPDTFFADRRNNLDFRVAKILRFGRTRTQVGVDIYNLTNTDVVQRGPTTFVPTSTAWLTPTGIQPARYVKISAQFDF